MKVSHSLRAVYAGLSESYTKLRPQVDNFFKEKMHVRWHYESRIKSLESYALKIESGKYDSPYKIDDFFACTVVVDNASHINDVFQVVCDRFDFKERRPPADSITLNSSHSFQFDDLRIYVKWKDNADTRPTDLSGLLFEVQVKTFLQHAWAIATHDLTYKTSRCIWPLERIAFQVKAMLEHAELSILEAEKLSTSPLVAKEDKNTVSKNEVLQVLLDAFGKETLPQNSKLLSAIVYKLIKSLNIGVEDLQKFIAAETAIGRGTNTSYLSPYSIIIQTLFYQCNDIISRYLIEGSNNEDGARIVIADEIETMGLDKSSCNYALFLNNTYPI